MNDKLKSAVPVIDISGYFSGRMEQKLDIARQIDAAARAVGFFVVSGHGVDTGLIADTHRVSKAFYDLPQDGKNAYYSGSQALYRGYFALGGLAASQSIEERKSAPDYREMYVAAKQHFDRSDPYYQTEAAGKIFAPNIWPQVIPGFEETWVRYYAAMEKLAETLIHLCALALKLQEDWFDAKFANHMSTMAVTNYPDQLEPPLPGQLRCGAHTDYGALTLLMAEDKPGGLEVLTKDGEWAPVPMVPNTFIVNLGDLMQRWTNDVWISSMHRVANPPSDKANDSRRQSLIYFLHPNHDAVIECIPSCAGGEGARYEPITTQRHLFAKISRMQDVKN
jgi:isopenicillin N synthase-like dioxygenase